MISFGNLAIIILVFLILFGAKKIPEFMTNLAIGIKSFKKAIDSDVDENFPSIKASSKIKQNKYKNNLKKNNKLESISIEKEISSASKKSKKKLKKS